MNRYQMYLDALNYPYKKLAKLEFLQPDGSVAFSLDNQYKSGYMRGRDSRAFLQSGNLSVSLQNGKRRQASITLSNLDNAFDYAINKIWFGQRVRLSMGMVLPDGSDFYLPQGVFYLENPTAEWTEASRTVTYNLTDKWAYLDGSLLGTLESTYQVNRNTNIFEAMASILRLSKMTYGTTTDTAQMIDNVTPIFTDYYNGRTYSAANSDGSIITDIAMTAAPYTLTAEGGQSFADMILLLNDCVAGVIGYDQTGALRVDASQDDIDDIGKPTLWTFTPTNSTLFTPLTETWKNADVKNDVLLIGEGLTGYQIFGRAQNFDAKSDTNINLIGDKIYREEKANYWNTTQCTDLASWYLKRKTILQKSVTINAAQMFHLVENRLVAIQRTDKDGAPIERHLIQSFTVPIAEGEKMTINATSVSDLPDITVTSSSSS